MKFRNVCFTCNNYSEDQYDQIIGLDCWRYVVIGKEVGDEGTPHLQGYGMLIRQMRDSQLRKLLEGCHIEPRKGTHVQAYDYCIKDGKYEERGTPPRQGKRTDLDDAIATLKEHGCKRVAEDHPREYIKFSRGFRDLALQLQLPYEHTQVRGIWIHGPPGTGKSHSARSFSSDLYIKAQNKWFDGYDGERVILLDDLDTGVLGHHLKIWADKYACTGETKGGTIHLRHHLFIVTSNYKPEHFWIEDPIMLAAVERRFNVIEKLDRNQIINYLTHE